MIILLLENTAAYLPVNKSAVFSGLRYPSTYTVYQKNIAYRELAKAKNGLTDSGPLRKVNKNNFSPWTSRGLDHLLNHQIKHQMRFTHYEIDYY
jgi:hypothetical protein